MAQFHEEGMSRVSGHIGKSLKRDIATTTAFYCCMICKVLQCQTAVDGQNNGS